MENPLRSYWLQHKVNRLDDDPVYLSNLLAEQRTAYDGAVAMSTQHRARISSSPKREINLTNRYVKRATRIGQYIAVIQTKLDGVEQNRPRIDD